MSGLPSDCYQRTVSRIDGVDCHAVVTVVGTVYEASIGRHRDFRGGAVPRKRRRKRDDLNRENITQQAAHLTLDLPLLLPGIHVIRRPQIFFAQADASSALRGSAMGFVGRCNWWVG